MEQSFVQQLAPERQAYEANRRKELLDEAFAYFFDHADVTSEQGFAEIKASVQGWRDYYAEFVAKADQLLKLLGDSNES
jgi:hypothetical protein